MNRHHLMILAPVAALLAAPALAQTTTPSDPMNRQAPTYDTQMQPDPAKPRKSEMDKRTDAQRRAGQMQGQTEVPQSPTQPEVPQPMTVPENPTSPLPPPQTPPPQAPTPPQA